ncbi:MAG: hypothetical protein Q9187_005886, partial [Circinaria calcarea]
MANLQLQWDLSRNSATVLSVAQGIVRASTHDNVQILALLACERFGATLAICPETRRKVEHQVLKVQTPITSIVDFLGATVGYSSYDCASQMAKSLAGVNFLSLAATLVPSIGAYEGGKTLALMLENSAADKTFLPPERHLKDLLSALEYRCVRLGFSDLVVGWQKLLSHAPQCSEIGRGFYQVSNNAPSSEGLDKLVGAFRQLGRIGDVSAITITARQCTAWIAAFTQWCLGVPPSVLWCDGTPLLEQLASRVTLITQPEFNTPSFDMVIHRGLGDPTELIKPEPGELCWSGMLTIEAHGQWLLRELRFDVEDTYKAVAQALPYALKQVLIMLRPPRLHRKDRPGSRNLEGTLRESAAYPFSNDSVVSKMLSRMLGIAEPTDLLTLEDGLLIADLPLFGLQIKKEKEACVCTKCSTNGSNYTSCKVLCLWEDLATFVADILLLSLFASPERLLVQLNIPRTRDEKLTSAIQQLLLSGQPAKCHVSDILDTALTLVGHRVSKELRDRQWVISCHKGQAVYPRVFETQRLDQKGYLTLSWVPGLLSYEGTKYTQGICRQDSYNSIDESVMFETSGVDRPRNLSLNQSLVWRVAHGDEILHVNIAAQFDSFLSPVLCWPPFRLLTN